MDEISIDDVHQMYVDSVVQYKGNLVYVIAAERGDNDAIYLSVERLHDRMRDEVKFEREEFKAPSRIGYVNHGNSAWFFSRTPGRMFKIGLTGANCKIVPTEGFGLRGLPAKITSPGLQAAHDNNYPSLYKAWLAVKDKEGHCCAFDHQFAICYNRFIYFKGKKVGEIPKGNVRKSNIVWANKFEFLADILEPDYEKTVRTFK